MAANIAPGMKRSFLSGSWENLISKKLWDDCYEEACDLVNKSARVDITGFDLDPEMIRIAMQNALAAGVEDLIHFEVRDVAQLSHSEKYGFMITNPPYGERLEEKSAIPALYKKFGERFKMLDTWSLYVITSYEGTEKDLGRKADKNRKIYNGMMKTYYYQFMGPKPPKPDRGK